MAEPRAAPAFEEPLRAVHFEAVVPLALETQASWAAVAQVEPGNSEDCLRVPLESWTAQVGSVVKHSMR